MRCTGRSPSECCAKYVAFPCDFTERYDEQERDLALAHELGHHVRGDLIANWVALVVLAIHWFNPVAWRAFRAFRADQEMACDALVLAGRAQALRHAYGRAIVKSAHGGAVSAACHLHTINEAKGGSACFRRPRRTLPPASLPALVGTGVLGPRRARPHRLGHAGRRADQGKVATVTGVTLDQDVPAPPPPPPVAAPAAQRRSPLRRKHPAAPAEWSGTSIRSTRGGEEKDGKRVTKIVMTRADGSSFETKIPMSMRDPRQRAGSPQRQVRGHHGRQAGRREVRARRQEGDDHLLQPDREDHGRGPEGGDRRQTDGMQSAMMGLRMARRSIEGQFDLSTEQRAMRAEGHR